MAQRHVTEGRRIVAEQRDRVAKLVANGCDAREAKRDLQLFEDTLAIFEEHLESLQQSRAVTLAGQNAPRPGAGRLAG